MADDAGGYRSVNPLFMKYTPTDGEFSGQNGYGYRYYFHQKLSSLCLNCISVSDLLKYSLMPYRK